MKRTLYYRLIFTYLLYGLIAFSVIFFFTQQITKSYMKKYEANQLYREATIISSDFAAGYFNQSISVGEMQTHLQIIADYMSAEIWIITPEGELLLSSANPEIALAAESGAFIVKVKDFDITEFDEGYYDTNMYPELFDEEMLTVYSPISVSYKPVAYVMLHKSVDEIIAGSEGFTNISFYTVLIVFLFAFVLILLFTRSIYRPLKKITTAAQGYAKGDFSDRIDVRSNDELGFLADTMNYMATELDSLESDQRKFISDVSHDFRSPLTSIKGYVEAMKDGTIPVEMQEKYLNIILYETDRLTKLTQSLLDLNQMGHGGLRLDRSDFDINTIIRTTLLTFEGTCTEKGISVDLVLTGEKLFVNADMTKIQQVIYNLVDNATKFSGADSTIKVETSIKNEKVLISVKDSGIGIPKESIGKIWERFYKSDLSRGKDKRGSGLGLSIVKEIINAHDEHINVISTEGVGTEFIFTLPLSKKEG